MFDNSQDNNIYYIFLIFLNSDLGARRQAQEAEQPMEQAGTPRNIDTRNMTAAEKELVSELGPMIEEGSDEDEVGTVL